jgi:hypothetical protein
MAPMRDFGTVEPSHEAQVCSAGFSLSQAPPAGSSLDYKLTAVYGSNSRFENH